MPNNGAGAEPRVNPDVADALTGLMAKKFDGADGAEGAGCAASALPGVANGFDNPDDEIPTIGVKGFEVESSSPDGVG